MKDRKDFAKKFRKMAVDHEIPQGVLVFRDGQSLSCYVFGLSPIEKAGADALAGIIRRAASDPEAEKLVHHAMVKAEVELN